MKGEVKGGFKVVHLWSNLMRGGWIVDSRFSYSNCMDIIRNKITLTICISVFEI